MNSSFRRYSGHGRVWFQVAGADPEDIFGWRIAELVPHPIPSTFRMLDADERGWRGRAAIRLWLLGFSVRSAWLFALSEDVGWCDYLSHQHFDLDGDRRLPGEVLRRRLMDVAGFLPSK
jgi:hypothetical protein